MKTAKVIKFPKKGKISRLEAPEDQFLREDLKLSYMRFFGILILVVGGIFLITTVAHLMPELSDILTQWINGTHSP